NSIGIRLACRSFHAATRRPASSRICASVARCAAAFFSAAAARRASILRRLKPMVRISPRRDGASQADGVYVVHVRTFHLSPDVGRDRAALPADARSASTEYPRALQYLPDYNDRHDRRARGQARARPHALGPRAVMVVETAQGIEAGDL